MNFTVFNDYFFIAKSNVFVWDMNLVKELLSKERFGDFYKGAAYDASHPLIGDGLLATPDSETWRNQRKIAQTGFRLNILETAGHTYSTHFLLACKLFTSVDPIE